MRGEISQHSNATRIRSASSVLKNQIDNLAAPTCSAKSRSSANGGSVGDELAHPVVRKDLLRGNALGLAECCYGLADLAALGVRAGNVDEHPRTPFGGQAAGVDGGGGAEGMARIAQLDRNRDLVQGHVGRAELGVVVVASLAQPGSGLPGLLQMAVGRVRVVETRGDDGALQGQPAPQRYCR